MTQSARQIGTCIKIQANQLASFVSGLGKHIKVIGAIQNQVPVNPSSEKRD
jgi:hypothetical protein